jgi:hypothetical protein
MLRVRGFAFAIAAVALVGSNAAAQDANHNVAGGGISVAGWAGAADGTASVNDSKFAKEGNGFHVTTGPAVTYWNAGNKGSGTYTVKATFTEPKFQNLNTHPHPYGIMVSGNDLGTANATYLYCAVNGNGSFIVRGFGPAAFQMNGGRGQVNAAVHKAAAVGETVTNEVAMTVTPDKVSCSMNGTEVASYPKADLMAKGLKSLDGVWGMRFAHNTEVTVTTPAVSK